MSWILYSQFIKVSFDDSSTWLWALDGMVNVSSLRELVCPKKVKVLMHPVPLMHGMQ